MSNTLEFEKINNLNTIVRFLAKRDISELSAQDLKKKFGITQVDMIIILGNSIPYIAELGARAYKSGLAKEIMIAGGIGHATKYLCENILKSNKYRNIDVENKSEAEILKQIVVERESIPIDDIILEDKSTNCGSNAHEALKLLRKNGKIPKTVILLQDPIMQLRSHASFLKAWSEEDTTFISFSPFIPELKTLEVGFQFNNGEIEGLWSKERFIDLVMGEIPRLKDDEKGYGPKGKGFIEHVDIPEEVLTAYKVLLETYSEYDEIKERK